MPAAALTGVLTLGIVGTNEWKSGAFTDLVTLPVVALTPMTTVAIAGLTPARGWLVCDTTLGKLKWYNGVAWETITSV